MAFGLSLWKKKAGPSTPGPRPKIEKQKRAAHSTFHPLQWCEKKSGTLHSWSTAQDRKTKKGRPQHLPPPTMVREMIFGRGCMCRGGLENVKKETPALKGMGGRGKKWRTMEEEDVNGRREQAASHVWSAQSLGAPLLYINGPSAFRGSPEYTTSGTRKKFHLSVRHTQWSKFPKSLGT